MERWLAAIYFKRSTSLCVKSRAGHDLEFLLWKQEFFARKNATGENK